MDARYALRFLRHDLFRMTLLYHRDVHCHIATGQQSGSHWLNNMLAEVIVSEYDVPRPQHIDDRVLIGHPRNEATHAVLPRLVWTHHAPSPLVHAAPTRQLLRFPRYVVLLRDLRAAMVSRYEKRKDDFGMTFSQFVRERRVWDNPVKWDLHKRISFFNSWGRVERLLPQQTLITHYEHFLTDAPRELERIWRFMELPVSDPAVFRRAAEATTKSKMSRKEQPGRQLDLVRLDDRDPVDWFSDEDRRYFSEQCRRHLKYNFGYNFDDWTSARKAPTGPIAATVRRVA